MVRWLETLRQLEARARRRSGEVVRTAGRFRRTLHYVLHLLVWSRVFATRHGLQAPRIPESLRQRMGVVFAPPGLETRGAVGAEFGEAFGTVNVILFGNLQRPDLLSPHRHALPGPAFRGVYLWDSAFIAQIWRYWDPAVAADVLRSVIALRDGPRLQHVVADFVASIYTQPPLIAWAFAELNPDPELAAEVYPALAEYHAWLRRERGLPNGLFAWAHPYESGIDNSPRFSTRDERRFRDTRRLAAPDFSAYVVLQSESLAVLARAGGRDAEALAHEAEVERIRAAMRDFLWHAEDGMFYDRDVDTGEWMRVRTIASLLPLWAGVPDAAQARRLRDAAMDPRAFGTLIPLPSVAADDATFEKDMWRGPVWVNVAYAVVRGLQRYGFHREAGELAWRLCAGVYAVFAGERQIYEFYDPHRHDTRELRRKRGNWWKAFTLGTGPQRDFVGWSGLVNTLVVEVLFGLERMAGGGVAMRPGFPDAAVGGEFRLVLPAWAVEVTARVERGGACDCMVSAGGDAQRLRVPRGERVVLDQGAGVRPGRENQPNSGHAVL